jgi:hypothetical protein
MSKPTLHQITKTIMENIPAMECFPVNPIVSTGDITNAAQAILDMWPDEAERIKEIAEMFGVCDGGQYINDWKTVAKKYQAQAERIKELEARVKFLEKTTKGSRVVELEDMMNADRDVIIELKETIATLTAELSKLQDPAAVWANICRGTIAKPSQQELVEALDKARELLSRFHNNIGGDDDTLDEYELKERNEIRLCIDALAKFGG